MRKVLWLTSWYPNATDPFSGDFIKRQAEAVSIFQFLKILYVGKNSREPLSNTTDSTNIENEQEPLEETIIYYPVSASGKTVFSKFKSLFSYFNRHLQFIKQLRKRNELPELIHVHVAMKAGLVALFLKWKYKIPYVLTEHWSGYYAVSKDSLFRKSYLIRYMTKLIIKNAASFLPVSDALGNQINQHWIRVPFQKIPNVVNTRLFFPSEIQPVNGFRFIHISSLLYPKNPEGIIRAFTELLNHGFKAQLVLVGPLNHALNEFIQSDRPKHEEIHCTGEISYEQVGIELRKSSSLVMFSFYENMPCVVLEALCTGIPVIATRVGGIPEVIHKENGILINAGNENDLFEAMKEMILNHHVYDKDTIGQLAAEEFSYESIGQKIIRVYDSVLEKK